MLKLAQILLLILLFLAAPAVAQEKKSAEKKSTTEAAEVEDGAEKEKEKKGLQINKLLPLNKPNLRVKIPGFDKGELSSMIEAEKLTRVDDSNLMLETAIIQLIPQALTIRLRSALYNTDAAVLSSNESTTISSAEFTMTGDSMDFDTETGKGQMIGKTRMIIHNVDAMGGGAASTKDKGKATAKPETATSTTTNKEETKK